MVNFRIEMLLARLQSMQENHYVSPLKKIRIELRRRQLRQRDIARNLGISEFRMSRILGGELRARPRERRCIAGMLGVPVGKLFRRRRRKGRVGN